MVIRVLDRSTGQARESRIGRVVGTISMRHGSSQGKEVGMIGEIEDRRGSEGTLKTAIVAVGSLGDESRNSNRGDMDDGDGLKPWK